MNKPSGSEYPTVTAYDINDSTVLSQVYSLVQQLATTYGTSRNPFRLYAIGFGPVFQGANASSAQTTLQTMQYYAGTQSQRIHRVAVESDHHRDGLADVDEHDRHLHQDPAKRRANRADQMTMPTLVAEFIDVSKTYRAPLRPGRTVAGPARSQLRDRTGRGLRAPGPQPGRQDDSAQDPPGPVPSQRRAACSGWDARSRSGAPSPASATCTRTRRFPAT